MTNSTAVTRRVRAGLAFGALAFGALALGGAALGGTAAAQPSAPAAPAAGVPPAETTAGAALVRGYEFESTSRPREAAAAFRRALALASAVHDRDTREAALLGLERAWSDAGRPDSTLAVATDAVAREPIDPVANTILLRTLLTLGRDGEARAAYDRWRAGTPSAGGPYVEFVRLLLEAGRRGAADSVLADADRAQLDAAARRALLPSRARALAADRRWTDAARAWRTVLADDAVWGDAAVFSLRTAPDTAYDGVVAALTVAPAAVVAQRAAAGLLALWHRPTAAWTIAAALPRDTASLELWRGVAGALDASGARRDGAAAWTRVLEVSPPASAGAREAFARAADDALLGGDPAGALALLDRRPVPPRAVARDSTEVAVRVLRVRALAGLGRIDEAERAGADLPTAAGTAAANAVAAAWFARGDLARADAVLRRAGADSSETAGWVALAGGDLRRARALFARGRTNGDNTADGDAPARGLLASVRTAARGALARTRADTVPALGSALGDALLAAARGDGAAASAALERAGRALPDANALLLTAAADVASGAGDRARAAALWQRVLAESADAPEAPAAELAWGRSLLATGDRAAARARFEHLVVTYPESALVPLARRELDRLGPA